MAEALIKNGKHTVTALTRSDSQSTLPEGIIVKKVNYDDQSTLVEALKGQDALIITLGGQVSSDTDEKLIRAAGEAGVKWILPNEWGPDNTDEAVTRDVFVLQGKGMPPNTHIISCLINIGRQKPRLHRLSQPELLHRPLYRFLVRMVSRNSIRLWVRL